jgi:hypothetical protein
MLAASIAAKQTIKSSSNTFRSFSSSMALAGKVQKLGVVGAGQMVSFLFFLGILYMYERERNDLTIL